MKLFKQSNQLNYWNYLTILIYENIKIKGIFIYCIRQIELLYTNQYL